MFRVGLNWRFYAYVVSSATCTATTEGWQASSLVERARGRRSTRGTARLAALALAARGRGRREPPEAIGGGGWDPPSARASGPRAESAASSPAATSCACLCVYMLSTIQAALCGERLREAEPAREWRGRRTTTPRPRRSASAVVAREAEEMVARPRDAQHCSPAYNGEREHGPKQERILLSPGPRLALCARARVRLLDEGLGGRAPLLRGARVGLGVGLTVGATAAAAAAAESCFNVSLL